MRNFISGNHDRGVLMDGSATSGNLVQGNTIGLNVIGAGAPNLNRGVEFFGGAHSNTIGGTATGASNVIAGNTGDGILVYDGGTDGTINNGLLFNSISGNTGLGIELLYGNGGPSHPNNGQAAPTLTSNSAVLSTIANPGGTDISGTLTSTANTNFRIEFFASPGGTNQGQYFIGSTNLSTNGAGNGSFTALHLAAAVPSGNVITATATDMIGNNTSQFSAPQTVSTTDTDGDGIPDNWENAHMLNPSVNDANIDSDGDGLTNLQEFKAGTDPKNPTSQFRISSIVPNAGNYQIGFPSVLGKTYRLEYRDDLATGNWKTLTDQIFGTGATIQINDPSATGLTKRFYRLSLEP
jgi:thrombospondin type 3 repeat protein